LRARNNDVVMFSRPTVVTRYQVLARCLARATFLAINHLPSAPPALGPFFEHEATHEPANTVDVGISALHGEDDGVAGPRRSPLHRLHRDSSLCGTLDENSMNVSVMSVCVCLRLISTPNKLAHIAFTGVAMCLIPNTLANHCNLLAHDAGRSLKIAARRKQSPHTAGSGAGIRVRTPISLHHGHCSKMISLTLRSSLPASSSP